MAIYLDEDCLGEDDTIGFPHLLLCMGVVLLTRNAMYGVHIVSKSDQGGTIPEFGRYINAQNIPQQDMLTLYGSCNFTVRYGNNHRKAAWKTELRHIAGEIGFPAGGNVKGFNTSIINPADGTYVEYVRNPLTDNCRIFYKRNEKMDFGPKTDHVMKVKNFPHITQTPWASHNSANIIHTASNQGRLHEVNYFLRLKSFTI